MHVFYSLPNVYSAKVSRWRSANLAHDALVHIQLIPEAKSIQLHELFKVFTNEGTFEVYNTPRFPLKAL